MSRSLKLWVAFALASVVPSIAAAAQDPFPEPVVVVYPFTVSGSSVTSQVGGNVALLLATRLQAIGGVTVKPFTPGTVRADYLTAARAESADYYVTGFLTPIGSEVSLITQVVTTNSGLVVWSNSTTIRTYGDASAQADPLHQAIVAHAERSLSAIPAQGNAATPVPASSDAASFNVTRALGHHHKGSAPSPSPSPAAVALMQMSAPPNASPAPAASPSSAAQRVAVADHPGALVTDVGGTGDAATLGSVGAALVAALRHGGVTGGGNVTITGPEAIAHAADLCRANAGTKALYVPTVAVSDDGRRSVTLDVTAYNCMGSAIGTAHDVEPASGRRALERAIDRAAGKTIEALLRPVASPAPKATS